jgi:hypothetical protein
MNICLNFLVLDLHPLALEDILHARKQNRSKADYYSKHLFLQILCHELKDVDEDEDSQTLTGMPLSSSPEPMSEEDNSGDLTDGDPGIYGNGLDSHHRPTKKRRFVPHGRLRDIEAMLDPQSSHSHFVKVLEPEGAVRLSVSLSDGYSHCIISAQRSQKSQKIVEHEVSLEALKKVGPLEVLFVLYVNLIQGERVNIRVSPMFIFLFRDGTYGYSATRHCTNMVPR